MGYELRMYTINQDEVEEGFNYRNLEAAKDYEALFREAKRQGTSYSLTRFQHKFNFDLLNTNNDWLLIAEVDIATGELRSLPAYRYQRY